MKCFSLLYLVLPCLLLLAGCDSNDNSDGGALQGDMSVRIEAPSGTAVGYALTYITGSASDGKVEVEPGFTAVDGEEVIDLEDGRDGYLVQVTLNAGGPVTVSLLSGDDVLDTDEVAGDGEVAEVAAGAELPDFGSF